MTIFPYTTIAKVPPLILQEQPVDDFSLYNACESATVDFAGTAG